MDAIYIYMELLALVILVCLCKDMFKARVVRKSVDRESPQSMSKPLFMFRPQRNRAPLQSRRLRHNRSSFAR
ncbi:hypothetical protein AWB74_03952 [Caballeronia arvi]|uniref:Uncharacterized protein n=1 Tax=Caballeronia arvi TaxID=1777135 RepID=A0A158JKP9_9BURK|nr:hypothetical protein AWB74_03952 [Caballeronia arvi]